MTAPSCMHTEITDKFTGRIRICKKDIKDGLARLGMKAGDVVMVHSSLSRFGYVEGGAETVIQALLETLGDSGTLMMSAITTQSSFVWSCIEAADKGIVAPVEPFDVGNKNGWAGTIAETFRKMPGVKRSFHPTHSVTAFGAHADELIYAHENAPGPCGEGTPYARICDFDRGFFLLLGVSHQSNTAQHGMEELAGVEYVLYPKWVRIPVVTGQGAREAHTRVHNGSMDRNLSILETEYINRMAQTVTHIGESYVRFTNARLMRDISIQALQKDPWLMLTEKGRQAFRIMKESGMWNRSPFGEVQK